MEAKCKQPNESFIVNSPNQKLKNNIVHKKTTEDISCGLN